MITPRIVRAAENNSTNYNSNKPFTSEQRLAKMKAKALGDVQNTLHSRTVNYAIPDWSSSVKILTKSSVYDKATSRENSLMAKSAFSGNKLCLTPLKSVGNSHLVTPSVEDGDLLEIHNHILCELEEKSYVNDYFIEYRFSEEQIENLAQSVKCSVTPVLIELYEPCEDIIIPDDIKPEEQNVSLTDISDDVIVPKVPPPVLVL